MTKKFSIGKDPKKEREAAKYENPVASREYIIKYFKFCDRPLHLNELEQQFKITSKDQKIGLTRRLKAMLRDAQLMQDRAQRYALVEELQLEKSMVFFNKELGMYVKHKGDDIAVETRFTHNIFVGDGVLVRLTPEVKNTTRYAIVVEVLQRKHINVTGRFYIKNGLSFIEPFLKEFKTSVIVAENKLNAKLGDYVVAKILNYPDYKNRNCVASISKVIGEEGQAGIELEVALNSYDMPHSWSDEVYKEVEQIPLAISDAEIAKRVDLRHLPFVTIDGEDSRDFDDAVYASLQQDCSFVLYVAIADVSHYVQPQSGLDKDAFARGTSVYFPREVLPMLPEALSNNVCSLLPKQDRLVLVAKMSVSATGELHHYEFMRAVIHSHARLTYTNVSKMLADKLAVPAWLKQPLHDLDALYQKLALQRKRRGAIEFKTRETKLVFNKDGKIAKIVPIVRNRAHMIIEECMLLANHAAASLTMQRSQPVLYRVHAMPEIKKIKQLHEFLATLNIKVGSPTKVTAADFNEVQNKVKGESYEGVVNIMLLRTMSQAVYQSENIGHYGLCFDNYLHFTSPIRRYPDLLAHRAIISLLDNTPDVSRDMAKNIAKQGEHCSFAERRADNASRDVVSWLKCIYMKDRVGENFAGVISSVTTFGVFVELENIFIDGLIHISELGDDYYDYDSATNSLHGRRSNKIFKIGSRVEISVSRVDVNAKYIDFHYIRTL